MTFYHLPRFFFVIPLLLFAGLVFAGDDVTWYDASTWPTDGQGWNNTLPENGGRRFARIPGRMESVAPKGVWTQAQFSAGLAVLFKTDANKIQLDYTLFADRLSMVDMPATGVSGIDFYIRDGDVWRWAKCTRPTSKEVKTVIMENVSKKERLCCLYLPLYNGIECLKIGVPEGSSFEAVSPSTEKPVVYYGTSIANGGCASRPGMAFPAILGRKLDRPVVNLGFGGAGRMETPIVEMIAELDAAVFVIDCLPNMVGPEVAQRTIPLVKALREKHPETPIVLVEDRTYSNAWLYPHLQERHAASRKALKESFQKLRDDGIGNLHYVPADTLLGEDRDDDATVDSSHPTDLGMFRMAESIEKTLRPLLKSE